MAVLTTNKLNGTVGVVPDNASLSATNTGAPITIADAAGSAVYDDEHLLLGLSSVKISTRPTRAATSKLSISLTESQQANPWYIRFYCWTPSLPLNQVSRAVLFRVGAWNFTFLPTAAGNISMRAYGNDDLGATETNPVLTGDPVMADQWIRWELHYDPGTLELAVHCFPGHATSGQRIFTYSNIEIPEVVELLTNYQFRRRWLTWGENSTAVQEYQTKLNQLGYNAGTADGIYGQGTANAFEAFQADVGLPVGAGRAENGVGPEDLAALDMVHSEDQTGQPFFTNPVWLSHVEVNDSAFPGPAQAPESGATGGVQVSGQTVSAKTLSEDLSATVVYGSLASSEVTRAGQAQAGVQFSGTADGIKGSSATGDVSIGASVQSAAEKQGGAQAGVQVSGAASGDAVRSAAPAADAVFGGTGDGTKSVLNGSADGTAAFSGDVDSTSESLLPNIPRVGLRYRLIAYAPNGEMRGQLPYPVSFQLAVPYNDIPSMTLEYSLHAVAWSHLSGPAEVAVEFAAQDSDEYVEYPGCRFLLLRNQRSFNDRTGVWRYTLPSYAWQLRKIRNIDPQTWDDENRRVFTKATVGEILKTFVDEAKARGNVPGLELGFDEQVASNGVLWINTVNIAFDAGQDLWSILISLTSQGLCDWSIHERTLLAYNAGGLADDRTDSVVLFPQRDIKDAPDDSSYEDLAARVFALGDSGAWYSEVSAEALKPWGNWEDFISQSGVSDIGTLATLTQWRLDTTGQGRTQMTREIIFPSTLHLPFIHYLPGDYIQAPGAGGQIDELRVHQITIKSEDPHGLTGNLVLNDRYIERDIRRDRLMASLTGGVGQTGGGQTDPDTGIPATPKGVLLSTATYLNELGEPRAQVTVSWQPVEENISGGPIRVQGYQVYQRAEGESEYRRVAVVDHPTTVAYLSPFDVGQTVYFRVRAHTRTRPGPLSAPVSIVTQPDTEAPPAPSNPVLTQRLGVVSVAWDGLNATGTGMPNDFDLVRVWYSATSSDPWQLMGSLRTEGALSVPDLPVGQVAYFRFTALDRSGNESDPSGFEEITPEQLNPDDFLQPGSIGYELLAEGAVRDDILADDAVRNRHIAAGEITGGKIRAYSIFADRLAIGSTQNLYPDSNFEDADLTAVRQVASFYSSTGNWTVAGFPVKHAENEADRNGVLYTSNAVPMGTGVRAALITGVDDSITGPVNANNLTVENAYPIGDARALATSIDVLYRGLGGATARFSVIWWLRTEGGTWSAARTTSADKDITGDGEERLTASVSLSEIGLSTQFTHFVPQWNLWQVRDGDQATADAEIFIYTPRVVAMAGTTEIEDGAITTDKIFANAITADKIAVGAVEAGHIAADAITTDKLAANAITAKHTITGATIQTEATANRGVKLTGSGLFAYDSVGNQTFSVSGATGNVVATGEFSSNASGQRAILKGNVWPGRAGVQFHTGINTLDLQPSIFSDINSSSGFGQGALVLLSAESTINSSGRTKLELNMGNSTGAALQFEYSTYGPIGVAFEQYNLYLRGRKVATTTAYDYMLYFRSTRTNARNRNITVTYGSAAPSGGRMAIATPYLFASGDDNFVLNGSAFVLGTQTLSQVVVSSRLNQNWEHRIQLCTMWISESANQ